MIQVKAVASALVAVGGSGRGQGRTGAQTSQNDGLHADVCVALAEPELVLCLAALAQVRGLSPVLQEEDERTGGGKARWRPRPPSPPPPQNADAVSADAREESGGPVEVRTGSCVASRSPLPPSPQPQPPTAGGGLGYRTCAQEAVSTKRTKTMGSSVAEKTIGTFLSQKSAPRR